MRLVRSLIYLVIATIHCVVLGGPVSATAQEAVPRVEVLLEEASCAYRDGEYLLAIDKYEKVCDLLGKSSERCLVTLGWLYSETGQTKKSVSAYERLFELSARTSVDYLIWLTQAYGRAGRRDDAIEVCRSFIRVNDQEGMLARAYNELGYLLAHADDGATGSLVEAKEAFAEALNLSDGKADTARLNLVEVLFRQGRSEVGLLLLNSIVDEDESRIWDDLRSLDLSAEITRHAAEIRGNIRARGKTKLDSEREMRVVDVSRDWVKPHKLYAPQPEYTEEARKAGVQGVVIMRVIIDENGAIAEAEVTKGLPMGLSESALAAVRLWRFRPAEQDGEPVAVYYNLTVNF